MRYGIITLSLAGVILLTGCRGAEGVHDRAYVRTLAVTENGSMSAAMDFHNESTEPVFVSGENFQQLREAAELALGSSLFTGHTSVIVLGESTGADTLEYLFEDWRVLPSCYVVYSEQKEWYNIFGEDTERLSETVAEAIQQGKAPECSITAVLGGLLGEEKRAEVPYIGADGFEGTHIITAKE